MKSRPDMRKRTLYILLLIGIPVWVSAQETTGEKNLGDKEYLIVKEYKPVLAESNKISDLPEGDTSSAVVPTQEYSFVSRKAETRYEAASIKAVKIKDEPLPKLYRCYLKAGSGNYSKYLGELSIASLRSQKGALGFYARHFSGSPTFQDNGNADYSRNSARLDGKYFLSHATLSGDLSFDRNMVHYYGYNTSLTFIEDKDARQRFMEYGGRFGIASTLLDSTKYRYRAQFGYSDLSDDFGSTESEFDFTGGVQRRFSETLLGLDVDLSFFTKKDASFQVLTAYHDLPRNILAFRPFVAFQRERIRFTGGVGMEAETNIDADLHIFPKLDVQVPVSDGVLRLYASLDGRIIKNNFHTVTAENPFITSSVIFNNTIEKMNLKAGLSVRFSDAFTLLANVGYASYKDLQLFFTDTVRLNNFNVIYDDATRANLHAELLYRATEKLGVSLAFDQYSYNMDVQARPWYLPTTTATVKADYNLRDKILVKAALFGVGERYALTVEDNGNQLAQKLKPYVDANLGFEYRYSKILSVFLNFNNVGMAKYQEWYGFPMERFNMLGGLTYSF